MEGDEESKAPLPYDENWLFDGKAFSTRQPTPNNGNYNLLDIQSIESIVPSFTGTGFRLYQSKSSNYITSPNKYNFTTNTTNKRISGFKRERSYEPSARY